MRYERKSSQDKRNHLGLEKKWFKERRGEREKEIYRWNNEVKQVEKYVSRQQKEFSQLLSEKIRLSAFSIRPNLTNTERENIRDKLTKEKTRSSTLEDNLTQKEKDIIQHKENIHKLTNRAEQEISLLWSKKAALEKLNGDILAELAEEKKKTNSLEIKLTQKESEIREWTNRAGQLKNVLSSLKNANSQLLAEKTKLAKPKDQVNAQLATEKTKSSTLENNLTLKEKEIVQLKEEIHKRENEAKLSEKEKEIVQRNEEIHKWKNRAKQFENDLSELLSENTALKEFSTDISSKLSKEKERFSTMEKILTQKEKDIDMWKNKAKQFEKDMSTNCDIRTELTKKNARSSTPENNLNKKEREIIRLRDEIDMWKNRAKQFEKDLSTNFDIRTELTKEDARRSTLENNLSEKEREIIWLTEERQNWKNIVRQFKKNLSSLEKKNSQLLSEITVLKKLNSDMRPSLAKNEKKKVTIEIHREKRKNQQTILIDIK